MIDDSNVRELSAALAPLGWSASWEFPGYVSLTSSKAPGLQVAATPDWESAPECAGEIPAFVLLADGGSVYAIDPLGMTYEVFDIIPWPFERRSIASYVEKIAPVLERAERMADDIRRNKGEA